MSRFPTLSYLTDQEATDLLAPQLATQGPTTSRLCRLRDVLFAFAACTGSLSAIYHVRGEGPIYVELTAAFAVASAVLALKLGQSVHFGPRHLEAKLLEERGLLPLSEADLQLIEKAAFHDTLLLAALKDRHDSLRPWRGKDRQALAAYLFATGNPVQLPDDDPIDRIVAFASRPAA